MSQRFVFTPEMGAQLRDMRKKSELTQSEVAHRMGLSGPHAKSWISSLESGRIKEPKLGTVILYLKACGSVMSMFFDRFNEIDFVPVEERFNEAWDKAGLIITEAKLPKWARARPDAKARVRDKTKWEVWNYQFRAVFPLRGKPVEPDKARAQAGKLATYRIQENIVRRAVFECLKMTKLPSLLFLLYTTYARSLLSVLRRLPDARAREELALKRDFVARCDLDPDIAERVERVVIETWAKIRS